jgi:hypothetical protein
MKLEENTGAAHVAGASAGIGATYLEALGVPSTRAGDETARPRRSVLSLAAGVCARRGIRRD